MPLETFGLAIGVGAGLLLPLQTCFNSRLREAVGSPFLSSLISFAGGTLFLAILTLLVQGTLLFPVQLLAEEPSWVWLGGFLGVIGLTTNIFIFPKLGGVQTAILPITGQIIMGIMIDTFGLLESAQTHITAVRSAGVALVIIGVLGAILLGQQPAKSGVSQDTPRQENLLGWQLLALGTGFLMAMQAAVNGHLGVVLGSSAHAAFVSFFTGTLFLCVLKCLLRLKLRVRVPTGKPANPVWMYFGGPLGAIFVACNALLVPVMGTGLTLMSALTGMITGSLIVDKFGLLEAPRRLVTSKQVISLLVMLGGIAMIRLL